MRWDDRSIRVIVGRKGAGKTLYLRRLQDAAEQEESLYADKWQASVFDSSNVIRVADWYSDSPHQAVEKWAAIWKVAILRSLVSHILFAPGLGPPNYADQRALKVTFGGLYPAFEWKESVYDQVVHILDCHTSSASLDKYLTDRRWSGLEQLLTRILQTLSPVCFYLDALDDNFEHAPRQWLICQLGLFQAVMALLKDPDSIGGRLHVVIGIRDVVMSARLAGEHMTKYVMTDNIRTLNWGREAISHFLDRKIQKLDSEYLMAAHEDHPIAQWLGRTEITNARGKVEDLRDYLLRHTRLIPRDVVVVGNMLCDLIDGAKSEKNGSLNEQAIRQSVRNAARRFGNESLMMVANHMTADALPEGAVEDGYAEVFTAENMEDVPHGKAMQEGLAGSLKESIGFLGASRFTAEDLQAFEARAGEHVLEGREILLDTLWQHGLLGYIEGDLMKGRTVFYDAATVEDELSLPRGRTGYVLHPTMIDTVPSLKGVGEPVRP